MQIVNQEGITKKEPNIEVRVLGDNMSYKVKVGISDQGKILIGAKTVNELAVVGSVKKLFGSQLPYMVACVVAVEGNKHRFISTRIMARKGEFEITDRYQKKENE